ncbi:hypothetical protein [Pseudotabrizicola alkalilacus]|nr:hypothetical protein [Pseudotabrizicola alkalilacus]
MAERSLGSVPFRLSGKILLLMAAFWVLLYFEPVQIGPLKVSQIWKVVLIMSLALLLLRRSVPLWFVFAFLFSFKQILYLTFPYGLMTAIASALDAMMFPLVLLYLFRTFKEKPDAVTILHNFSIYASLFFIFSAVPFLLGLQSLQPQRDLAMWGLESNAATGLFYTLAPASQTYLAATLVIMASYQRFSGSLRYIAFFLATIALGTYLVYFSYTRTGWIIYAGGVIILALSIKSASRKMMAISLVAMCAVAAYAYLAQNEAFLLRMAGGATYRQDVEVSWTALMQSRFPFIVTAIDNLNSFGLPGWLIGYGDETTRGLFLQKTGMAITSHNATTTILEGSGLIGLVVYFSYVAALWRRVRHGMRTDLQLRLLIIIGGYCWIATYVLSHGLPLYAQIAFAGIFASALVRAAQSGRRVVGTSGFGQSGISSASLHPDIGAR